MCFVPHLEDLLTLVALLLDPVLILPLCLLSSLCEQPGEVRLCDGSSLPDIIRLIKIYP